MLENGFSRVHSIPCPLLSANSTHLLKPLQTEVHLMPISSHEMEMTLEAEEGDLDCVASFIHDLL
jgi:hypothetical protein